MKKTAAPVGICTGCRHVSSCTFPRDSRHPVLECEEFAALEVVAASSRKQVPKDRPVRVDRHAAKHPGLCQDCENRKHCVFLDAEGGVWHCEEYR